MAGCATLPVSAGLPTAGESEQPPPEAFAFTPQFMDATLAQSFADHSDLTLSDEPVDALRAAVTYSLSSPDLLLTDQEIGSGDELVKTSVGSNTRLVLSPSTHHRADTRRVPRAVAVAARLAAERSRARHMPLQAVTLQAAFAQPPSFTQLVPASPGERQDKDVRLQLEVARGQASVLNQEAIGLKEAYRLAAPPLTESRIRDEEPGFWAKVMSSTDSPLHVVSESSLSAGVGVSP